MTERSVNDRERDVHSGFRAGWAAALRRMMTDIDREALPANTKIVLYRALHALATETARPRLVNRWRH